MTPTTRSESHRRLSNFVDWIKTPAETEAKIRTQAEEIRDRIKAQARADGLVVRSTPNSGSYAKRTGLRRHWNPSGGSPVEGQDVDLPFVVSPMTRDGESLAGLLDRFSRYATASYGSTQRMRTKSSIKLEFKASKLGYDLVPMLATDDLERQILLRADGERRETSVQRHVEFIRSRTQRSDAIPGRVKFNECLRLLKWWREFVVASDPQLGEIPTFVVDLLAAKAFDGHGVHETYTKTLEVWFACMMTTVRDRQQVAFDDYLSVPASTRAGWDVIDPVNGKNNVVASWTAAKVDRLAEALARATAGMRRAMHHEDVGDVNNMVMELAGLFGSPFKHHSSRNLP